MAALLLVVSTGCGSSPGRPASAPQPPSSPRPLLLVVWVGSGERDAYHCAMLNGARREAGREGVHLVVENPPGLTWEQQNAHIEEAISSHANAIVVDPVDYPRTEMVVRGAHDQEVHVVLVDVPPAPNPGLAWAVVDGERTAVGRVAVEPAGSTVGQIALDDAVAAAVSRPVPDRLVPPVAVSGAPSEGDCPQ